MDIDIDQVIPAFWASVPGRSSQVWGQYVQLKQGQCYALSAASGKGKSTLLHLLFWTRRIPSGRILINGQDFDAQNPEERSRLRRDSISMVFQDLRLFEHLTARENLLLKHQLNPHTDEQTIWIWAERLGILDLLDRPCGKLSLGQQQRVAAIRSLIQPFDWLLMDEPTSHLDQANADLLFSLVDEVCLQRGAGRIITTLDENPSFSYDQILYL